MASSEVAMWARTLEETWDSVYTRGYMCTCVYIHACMYAAHCVFSDSSMRRGTEAVEETKTSDRSRMLKFS